MLEIRIDKIRRNLAILEDVVPKKPSSEVLANVLLSDGKITGTDLDVHVILDMPETAGQFILLPLRKTLEMLKYVPGNETLTIESPAKDKVKLSWSSGSASFPLDPKLEFPYVEKKQLSVTGTLNGDLLLRALIEAIPYTAADTAKPTLSGVALYLGDTLAIGGSDGFRLSYQSLNMSYPVKQTLIIPVPTIKIVEAIWKRLPPPAPLQQSLIAQITRQRTFDLSLFQDGLMIAYGGVTIMSKVIAGTPPDHLAVFSGFKEPIKVQFMAPELYNALLRLKKIAKESDGIVRLLWTDNKMTVMASKEDVGDMETSFDINPGHTPGRVAMNIRYLLEYLSGKDGEVTMGMEKQTAPPLFHYGNRPIVAIMPMQVKWGDEPPEEIKEPEKQAEPEQATSESPAPASESEDSALKDEDLLVVPEGDARDILQVESISVKDLKAKIKDAEEQVTAWEAQKDAEGAQANIDAWQEQANTLNGFLDEQEEKAEEAQPDDTTESSEPAEGAEVT